MTTVTAFLYALIGLAFCLIGMIDDDLTGRISVPVRGVYLALTGVVLFVPDPRVKILELVLGIDVGVVQKVYPRFLTSEVVK